MKKLIVAAVAVAMSVVANAAQIKWSNTNGIADGTADGGTTAAVVYLINSATLTQSAIYDAVMAGATLDAVVEGKIVNSTSLADGFMDAQTFTTSAYADNSKQTMYMVCFDSDLNALYFSEELNKTILGTGATKYAFSANSSVEATMADMSGFDKSYGGWVSTAAVPEPTSGLLMLLGMAGLALRRRRA